MAPKKSVTQLDRVEEKVDRVIVWIHGDGSDGKPGIDKRVDRLEQTHRGVKWLAGLSLGSALTVAGAYIRSRFH